MIDPATATGAIIVAAVGTVAASIMIEATKSTLNYVKQSRHAEDSAYRLRFALERARNSHSHAKYLPQYSQAQDVLSRYESLPANKSRRKRAKLCRQMNKLTAELCSYFP